MRMDGADATNGCPAATWAFLSFGEAEALGQGDFEGDFAAVEDVAGAAGDVVASTFAAAGAAVSDGAASAFLPPPKRSPSQSSRPCFSSSVLVGDGLGLGDAGAGADVAPPAGAGWLPVLVLGFTDGEAQV